jgi:Tfp pilus assembly protein PilV
MSLIEIIFSVTLFCLIFMAMINILPLATFAIKRTEHRIRASALAQSVLEEKRAGPFSALDSQPVAAQQTDRDGTVYAIVYEAPAMDPGVDAQKLRRIVVTVTWKERDIIRSLTREMYLYNLPK